MTAEDIAEQIFWVASLPPHLNINRPELMPVSQSFAGFRSPAKADLRRGSRRAEPMLGFV